MIGQRVADLPTVRPRTTAIVAARALAGQNLPGLTARARGVLVAVVDAGGAVVGVVMLDSLLDRMLAS